MMRSSRRLLPQTLICLLLPASYLWGQRGDVYTRLRDNMVQEQLQARGIDDSAVLAAMRKVERHRFMPLDSRGKAYGDHPVPIGYGQTISQPYIVAFMTQTLKLARRDKALEIGTGSGYQAAILGELCDSVFSIELIPALERRARDTLNALGYFKIRLRIGDGYKGWPEHAPYNAIIVTCAPSEVPRPLEEQLAEGGRMVIPVGEANRQKLMLITKRAGRLDRKYIEAVRFVPMLQKNGKKY